MRPFVTATLAVLLVLGVACDPTTTDFTAGRVVFEARFGESTLGPDWAIGRVDGPPSKGGGPRSAAAKKGFWRVSNAALTSTGERNQPLWLKRALPEEVRIEFTARTDSAAGDIKFEVFGDGIAHESGYIAVFGGWNNSRSVLARRDEHEQGRVERPGGADVGRVYKMAVVRKASEVRWYIDGRLHLRYDDPEPLRGAAHRYFGFNNWRSKLTFDDLVVFDLGDP